MFDNLTRLAIDLPTDGQVRRFFQRKEVLDAGTRLSTDTRREQLENQGGESSAASPSNNNGSAANSLGGNFEIKDR